MVGQEEKHVYLVGDFNADSVKGHEKQKLFCENIGVIFISPLVRLWDWLESYGGNINVS